MLDKDVKLPNAKFYGGREHARTNFSFLFWIRINSLGILNQEKSRRFANWEGPNHETQLSLKRPQINFFSRRFHRGRRPRFLSSLLYDFLFTEAAMIKRRNYYYLHKFYW